MLYLDTSALLKLYVREAGSEWVQQEIESQDEPLPLWEIQEMELHNALMLKVFRGELSEEDATRQIDLLRGRKVKGLYYVPEIRRAQLMGDFRKLSALTSELGCRTMDILHVACALQLKPSRFISFDNRQLGLAHKAGLSVSTTEE